MIQRIQTIFLLLGAGSCFGLLGLPVAETDQAVEGGNSFFADQAYTIQDSGALLGIFLAAGLLFLGGIFLFRNRPLQMRLSLTSLFLVVLGVALGIYLYVQDPAAAQASVEAGVGLPALAAVFALLAYRFIKKDEKLVRSADRLR